MKSTLVAAVAILFIAVATANVYYGRVWGQVTKYSRRDTKTHHLVLQFAQVQDLDTGAVYPNFEADVNVRSNDQSFMFVALVNGSALPKDLVQKTQNAKGLKKLNSPGDGVIYTKFLQNSSFTQLSEDTLVAILGKLIDNADQVYLWGEVYHDTNQGGIVGIHDIHRITSSGGGRNPYGDGGFMVKKGSTYFGVFLHFANQPS
jgi:hypothetical protein